jgi:DNA-binding MarR family transcriptional regulator
MPLNDVTGMRSTVLAQRTDVTKQAMSQLISLLEERDYVEQVPDATDTRAKVIRLTKRDVAIREACVGNSTEPRCKLSARKAWRNSKRI